MTLQQVLTELNLDIDPEILAPHWDEDLVTLPDVPELLKPEVFLALRDYLRIDSSIDPILEEVTAEIRDNQALRTLWWHCHNLLFIHDYSGGQVKDWPVLDGLLGDQHGVFYLLMSLGAVPLMLEKHRALGVPDEISRGVYGNYEECIGNFQQLNPGLWGVDLRVIYWLRNDSNGILFRLGRLEYMNKPFHGQLRAFRHRKTGEVVALAEGSVCYTEEGYVCGRGDGQQHEPGAWSSTLEVDGRRAKGYPIHPAGHALQEVVELPLSEWQCVLQQGDHVLEMHIPGGGNFTPEACRDSMQQAAEFFPRYFPEQPFVGLGCMSWILNPQWHQVYRPDNNVTAWQREMYLFPIPSSGRDGLFFLFARDDIDPATAPRDTSMRRAVLDWLTSGKRLMGGGAFMLTEELAGYGSQFYLSQERFTSR